MRRPCATSGCPALVERPLVRCPPHDAEHAAGKKAHRRAHEPWRKLYGTHEWARAREFVKVRDGFRCRVLERCERCEETARLEVHHVVKLRELWARSSSFGEFVTLACDPQRLFTVCPHHNRALDQWKP